MFQALLVALLAAGPARATLVVAVPFRDGFVVASDRRATVFSDGTFVDDSDKIHAAGSALVVVTNGDRFWLKPDLARTTPPEFALSDEIVAMTPAAVRKTDVPGLATASARALGSFFESASELHPSEEIARVHVLRAPARQGNHGRGRVWHRRSRRMPAWEADWLISTDPSGTPASSTPELRDVGLDTPVYLRILGQPEYLRKVVDAGLLSPSTIQTLAAEPLVRTMDRDTAIAVVTDLVESAERATARITPRFGIGGGLNVWSVTRTGPHHLFTK